MGAESSFFVPGSEFAAMFGATFAAIRVAGEMLAPADGLSGGVATAVLGAEVWVVEFARSGVLVEGAATGEDVGAGAGSGCCPESWGALTGGGTGVVLELPNFS